MPKHYSTPKAPEIDRLAAHYLRRGLRKHPDVAQHVASVDDLDEMELWALLDLARKMGIDDANALIKATENDDAERLRWSHEHPAFKGEIEFDLAVEVFGKRVVRKAKAVYEFTPEWEYFDPIKRAPFTGSNHSSMHVEFLTVPEEDGDLGDPEWEDVDILGIGEVWNVIEDAIEEKVKAEDAERRRVAAARATSPARPSRRRH
jgi:hypothetical protein